MFTGKQAFIIFLILLTVVLLIQNSGSIPLRFAILRFHIPLPILLLVCVGIGIILGFWLDRPKSSGKK